MFRLPKLHWESPICPIRSQPQLLHQGVFNSQIHKVTYLHTQLCTQEQNSALLQLKRSFSLNKSASSYCDEDAITFFPKMESWKKDSDCCTWDGVHCDRETGEVIGLDLSCSWLKGTINPNSSLSHSFPPLQVLNLAYNDFAMSLISPEFTQLTQLTHLNCDSLTIVMKGSTIEMERILTIFTAIDFSRNDFDCEIPEIVGRLNSIRGLNLSHNSLTGHIPKSLGNLTKLEWLDLSSKKLTGEIPRQLTNLISLGTLNLSQNLLTVPIPQGKQFDTFSNDSYLNNLALCGPPLSNTCSDPEATQPPPSTFGKEEDSEPGSGFCWEVILPGYGFGLVVGLVIGYLIFTFGKPEWLVKMVEGVGNRNGKRLKSNARRHGGRRS